MISIFNRKEFVITYDMKKQSEIRTVLKNNEIEYKVKVKNILKSNTIKFRKQSTYGAAGIDGLFFLKREI